MKKKIRLIIFLVVLALLVGLILYLNRTVSGNSISTMLKEKEITKITITKNAFGEDPLLTKVLSEAEIADFLQLLDDAEMKIIRSNIVEMTDRNSYWIECWAANGGSLDILQLKGEDYLTVVSFHLDKYMMDYRVMTKDWRERLEILASD